WARCRSTSTSSTCSCSCCASSATAAEPQGNGPPIPAPRLIPGALYCELAEKMPVAIRPATRADIPAITRIYAHAVCHGTASFELTPPNEPEMARRYERLRAGAYPYLAATNGDEVVGYAYAGPYRDRPAYRWSVENSIYVAPQALRRGIG